MPTSLPENQEFDVYATLAQLFVYPVKSCAGIALDECRLGATGLAWDRAWMVVEETSGDFVTQRSLPRMALVRPGLTSDTLLLNAPDMPALILPLALPGPIRTVRVWKDTLPAVDMGPDAAAWFSAFLGQRLRLVRFAPEARRLSNPQWTAGLDAPNMFSDGYPVLVTSQAGLADLNRHLVSAGQAPVGMERFRPNVVLADVHAHDEDHLDLIRIETATPGRSHGDEGGGYVLLRLAKPCVRCPIPNIDPATGESDPAVGDALQAYRRDPRMDGRVTFGMNAVIVHGAGQLLRVGQAVRASWRFD